MPEELGMLRKKYALLLERRASLDQELEHIAELRVDTRGLYTEKELDEQRASALDDIRTVDRELTELNADISQLQTRQAELAAREADSALDQREETEETARHQRAQRVAEEAEQRARESVSPRERSRENDRER